VEYCPTVALLVGLKQQALLMEMESQEQLKGIVQVGRKHVVIRPKMLNHLTPSKVDRSNCHSMHSIDMLQDPKPMSECFSLMVILFQSFSRFLKVKPTNSISDHSEDLTYQFE
jgi:hypothetical protein